MALGKITVESMGPVKAPPCDTCKELMQPVNELLWACGNKSCACYGFGKLVSGVFPGKVFAPRPAAHVQINLEEDKD
jgi:hypothetical protein